MYIYNVTLKVDPSIEEDWLLWMKDIHIPEVLSCGIFKDHKMLLLTNSPFYDESPGSTFIVQYFFDNMEDYDRYQAEFAPAYQREHIQRYGEKVLAFRTVMKYI